MNLAQLHQRRADPDLRAKREAKREAERCPTCMYLPGVCRCWTPDERPNPFRAVVPPCISCTRRRGYAKVVPLVDCTCWERAVSKRGAA